MMGCEAQSNKKLEINDIKLEMEMLSDFLKENGYKILDSEKFRNLCEQYFYTNIIGENYIQPIGKNSYGLAYDKRFLNTFNESIFYNPDTRKESFKYNEAKKHLSNRENKQSQKFIAYNKLLFNDDISALSYFIQNEEDCYEIVVDFHYEKNKNLFNISMNYLSNLSSIQKHELTLILFLKQNNLRKSIIDNLYEFGRISTIEKIAESLLQNWESNNVSYDEALAYITNKFIQHDKVSQIAKTEEKLSHSYLYNFLNIDSDLGNRLEKKDFYNSLDIKTIIESYYIIQNSSDENTDDTVLAIIEDIDGYVNVRKSQDITSQVVGKIYSGKEVYTFPSKSDMWWVKTKEGVIGYVHKSRIKLK